MPWRVLEHAEQRWNVSIAAERRPNASAWSLVISFRAANDPRRSLWVSYPLESHSKGMLFAQAERISDDRLAAALAERLG
jgi:hypothetical protein